MALLLAASAVPHLELLFPVSVLALLAIAAIALRHRILAVMAWRNTQRRPRQSLLVVLGLLVGTAIISGALVAGDSMEYAIVEATYDAFVDIDHLVFLDGYNFFPQSVARSLAQDPILMREADAVGANILWGTAVSNLDRGAYEPTVRLVGFDPAESPPWAPFREASGRTLDGRNLRPDEVILHRDLAEKIGARVGDRLALNFTRPLDPILPAFDAWQGRTNTSTVVPVFGTPVDPQPWVQRVRVDAHTVQLSFVLGWSPGPFGQDLDLVVRGPSGTYHNATGGAIGAPDGSEARPVVLNITGTLSRPIERGEWTITVRGKAPSQTDFGLLLVRLEPVFDLAVFQARVAELREQFPDFDPSDIPGAFARESRTVRVAAIIEGGKGPNFKLPTALNLFARLDAVQEWLDREDQVNIVKVSAPGGVLEGGRTSAPLHPILWERLNATKVAHAGDPSVQALKATEEKAFWLEQARTVGQLFSVFLTFVGSFSVIAGLMLIVNIFTMLAEERKAELGMSRAVGLKRDHLTRLFTIEGALYALPAAALGTLVGLGLAYGLIWGFNFFGDPETFPPIPYRLVPASLLLAFATGILLTLGTVYVAARRVSRLNVVRAIRNLEEPEIVRGRLSLAGGTLLLAAGVLASLYAFATRSFSVQVVGPTLLALGLALLLRRRHRRQHVYPPLAVVLFGYLTATLFLIERYDTTEGNIFGPVRAVIMALCIVVLAVYTEAPTRLLGWLALRVRALRAVAIPATSYPLHKKFRTWMTLAMFAVILLIVSLFSIFGTLFQPNPEREAGGYDVEAWTQVPIQRLEDHGNDPHLLERVQGYNVLPYFLQVGGQLVRVDGEMTGQFGPPQDHVFGVSDAFARDNQFTLLRRDPAYATDAEAWADLARRSDITIVGYSYSTDRHGNEDRHGVGSTVEVDAKGGVKTFRVIGVMDQYHFKGIFVQESTLRGLYSNLDTLILLRLHEGHDARAFALELEAAYRDVGMDAESIRAQVLEESQQFRQIFTLIQLFLSLGLIVGILSLGIVTARSVIERRQEIGMMRALGYRRRDIRRTFLLEMLTTVTLGVLIGAALAILVSFGLWVAVVQRLNIPYVVPWGELVVIAAIAYVATTLATLGPIVRASRIPPAEALRYIE
jgi:putative ABC transport system permease protein